MKVLIHARSLSASLALVAGAGLLAAGCSETSGQESARASTQDATEAAEARPAPPTDAQAPAAGAEEDGAEAPAEVVETKAGSESPWTPPRLETGFDLSKVRVEVKPNPGPGAVTATPSANPPLPAPRAGTGMYAGGEPTEADLEKNADSGFLSVSEDGALHDFGGLTQGDVVEHTFELVATGEGPVSISQIKSSCGCTVAQTSVVTEEGAEPKPYEMGSPVPPGSRVLVGARLDTKGKRSRVRSVVTVMSSDPRGNLQLQLMADVVPFFEVTPLSLNFGTVKPDQVIEQELTVTSPSTDFFRLSVNEEVLPEELAVALEPQDPREDGRAGTWKVKVTLGPKIPEQARRNYQIILTSDQEVENAEPLPTGEMPVHQTVAYAVVSVLGMVSAEPHYMSFGLMREGHAVTRTVKIENHDDSFELPEPKVTLKGQKGEFEHPDAATIEVVPLPEGQGDGYEVSMTLLAPEGLVGTIRGMLVVEVGHPSKPTIELPFTGVVRAPARPAGGEDSHTASDGHDHGSH